MKKRLCRYMTIGWLLLAASLSAQAAPFYTNKEGNMVWDKATGLVWMRCSLGQTWDGNTCRGEASDFKFEPAQEVARSLNRAGGFGGIDDWKVPSAREFHSLLVCSTGWGPSTRVTDGGEPMRNSCYGNAAEPTIDLSAFPGTPKTTYWSSSFVDELSAWAVRFYTYDGGLGIWFRSDQNAVRLVRAGQLSGSKAALAFPLNVSEERQVAERNAQDKRVAAKNKERTDRAQALTQLLTLGARGLYLEGGKAQRNGAVTFVNTRFGASELYEMIVDKFPDSEYAVKATDQLTAMSRSSRDQLAAQSAVEQSNLNSRQRAYEVCKVEMNSCYSRTNGKGNCYRDCERLR